MNETRKRCTPSSNGGVFALKCFKLLLLAVLLGVKVCFTKLERSLWLFRHRPSSTVRLLIINSSGGALNAEALEVSSVRPILEVIRELHRRRKTHTGTLQD
eukprot:3040234-Amphidinium_carterae.1